MGFLVKAQTDAGFWKAAFGHIQLHPVNFSTDLHLSRLVCEFGQANTDKLDAAAFAELMAPIRKIDPSVAFALCDLEDQLLGGSAAAATDVSSLQQRCATALAESWKELDTTHDHIKSRKANFLVDLLGKCLSEAKAENQRLAGGAKPAPTPTGRGRSAQRPASASSRRTPGGRAARGSH